MCFHDQEALFIIPDTYRSFCQWRYLDLARYSTDMKLFFFLVVNVARLRDVSRWYIQDGDIREQRPYCWGMIIMSTLGVNAKGLPHFRSRICPRCSSRWRKFPRANQRLHFRQLQNNHEKGGHGFLRSSVWYGWFVLLPWYRAHNCGVS